ncbi:hypothetical protein SAMN05444166_3783 [Singulisphaera sp. GP187]|uniref:hypothetical protein n=1 Tax=Singulisphaera sp. GP187 TaxID=1882752 RepID=UPI000925C431|nr:hypothetical protein [Singulisphaera sp. GP187]SIO32357.1 hypothetical protein SAMN05444166_3783 [Singulisphaera sp. GP187]
MILHIPVGLPPAPARILEVEGPKTSRAGRSPGGSWPPRAAAIDRVHEVEAVAFARESAPATLAETLKQPGNPDDPATSTTGWQPVLAGAIRESDAPVRAIVLLTDGRQNAPGDSAATIDRLAARGIPVYPILIGSTVAPRDAAVASVRAPEGVHKGTPGLRPPRAPASLLRHRHLPVGHEKAGRLALPGSTSTKTNTAKGILQGVACRARPNHDPSRFDPRGRRGGDHSEGPRFGCRIKPGRESGRILNEPEQRHE